MDFEMPLAASGIHTVLKGHKCTRRRSRRVGGDSFKFTYLVSFKAVDLDCVFVSFLSNPFP